MTIRTNKQPKGKPVRWNRLKPGDLIRDKENLQIYLVIKYSEPVYGNPPRRAVPRFIISNTKSFLMFELYESSMDYYEVISK